MNDRNRKPDFPPAPLWWKVWFAVVAVVAVGLLGVGVWAVIKLVNHFTGG